MFIIAATTSVILTSVIIADSYYGPLGASDAVYIARRYASGFIEAANAKTLLESAMLICFSVSWPFKIRKLVTVKRSVGLSHGFLLMIITGYSCGIMAKILPIYYGESVNYFLASLYIVNLSMVVAVLALSIRYQIVNKVAACEILA